MVYDAAASEWEMYRARNPQTSASKHSFGLEISSHRSANRASVLLYVTRLKLDRCGNELHRKSKPYPIVNERQVGHLVGSISQTRENVICGRAMP